MLHYILIGALIIILCLVIGCVVFTIWGKRTVEKMQFIEDTSFAYTNPSTNTSSPERKRNFKMSLKNEKGMKQLSLYERQKKYESIAELESSTRLLDTGGSN